MDNPTDNAMPNSVLFASVDFIYHNSPSYYAYSTTLAFIENNVPKLQKNNGHLVTHYPLLKTITN